MPSDFKAPARVRADRDGWERLRAGLPQVCQLCGSTGHRRALSRAETFGELNALWIGLSVHHLVPKGQGGDDVKDNLAILCGHGTIGCHGDVEARRNDARERLREKLTPTQRRYILFRKGSVWLDRHYPVSV